MDWIKIIEKPWGKEEILEQNDRYMLKRLTMKKHHRCSIQFHRHKKETIYVLEGSLTILSGKDINNMEKKILGKGEFMTIEPYVIHRMLAEIDDCVYLESSTPDQEDVVRMEDDYGRR